MLDDLRIEKSANIDIHTFDQLRGKDNFKAVVIFEEDEHKDGGPFEVQYNGKKIYSETLYESDPMFVKIYGSEFIPVSYKHSGPIGYMIWAYVWNYWYIMIAVIVFEIYLRCRVDTWRGKTPNCGFGMIGTTIYSFLDFKDAIKESFDKKKINKINGMDMADIAKLVDDGKFDIGNVASEQKRKAIKTYLDTRYECLGAVASYTGEHFNKEKS
jgi:hypothetical protein